MTRVSPTLALLSFCAIALLADLACVDQSPSKQAIPEVSSGQTREIQIAAAADLKFALDEIVQEFGQERRDISVKVSYGSSGNFYSQLLNQAPFDIYFSADLSYPRQLAQQGLALPGSEFSYAVGAS